MDIYILTRKLQKECSHAKDMEKTYGTALARKLRQRLMEIKAADTLEDISHLPPARCHELTGRNGVYSVDLQHPYRLLFIPSSEPVPLRADGGVDRSGVTEIEVIAIEDTHDRKNPRKGRI